MKTKNEKNLAGSTKATETEAQARQWRAGGHAPVYYSDEELYEQSAGTPAGTGDFFWTYYQMLVAVTA